MNPQLEGRSFMFITTPGDNAGSIIKISIASPRVGGTERQRERERERMGEKGARRTRCVTNLRQLTARLVYLDRGSRARRTSSPLSINNAYTPRRARIRRYYTRVFIDVSLVFRCFIIASSYRDARRFVCERKKEKERDDARSHRANRELIRVYVPL